MEKDVIYRQIEYHFWSRRGDTMYIQTNRVRHTDKGFTIKGGINTMTLVIMESVCTKYTTECTNTNSKPYVTSLLSKYC